MIFYEKDEMNYKHVIALLAAFGLGGVAGHLFTKKVMEEQTQEDIEDVKEYYRLKYEKQPVNLKRDKEEYKKVAEKYAKPSIHSLVEREADVEEDEDDSLYYDTEEEEDAAALEYELTLEAQEARNDELNADGERDPYLIDYATFGRPSEEFDKVDLYYYRFDDTVCDSKDKVIDNPEDILGWDYLNALSINTTVFVRNEKIKTDYEIHGLSKSYSEEVTARLETDKEREYRRLARQKKAFDDIADEYAHEDSVNKAASRRARRERAQQKEEAEDDE